MLLIQRAALLRLSHNAIEANTKTFHMFSSTLGSRTSNREKEKTHIRYTTHKCRKVSAVSNDVTYLLELVTAYFFFFFFISMLSKQSLILLILDQFLLIYGPFEVASRCAPNHIRFWLGIQCSGFHFVHLYFGFDLLRSL